MCVQRQSQWRLYVIIVEKSMGGNPWGRSTPSLSDKNNFPVVI